MSWKVLYQPRKEAGRVALHTATRTGPSQPRKPCQPLELRVRLAILRADDLVEKNGIEQCGRKKSQSGRTPASKLIEVVADEVWLNREGVGLLLAVREPALGRPLPEEIQVLEEGGEYD